MTLNRVDLDHDIIRCFPSSVQLKLFCMRGHRRFEWNAFKLILAGRWTPKKASWPLSFRQEMMVFDRAYYGEGAKKAFRSWATPEGSCPYGKRVEGGRPIQAVRSFIPERRQYAAGAKLLTPRKMLAKLNKLGTLSTLYQLVTNAYD